MCVCVCSVCSMCVCLFVIFFEGGGLRRETGCLLSSPLRNMIGRTGYAKTLVEHILR